MFNEVLNEVKSKEGKKVNLNILISPSMKEEFDKLCKEHDTTMTAMLIGFIEKSLKDNPNYEKLSIEELEIEELTLEHQLEQTSQMLDNFPDYDYDDEELAFAKSSLYRDIEFYRKQLSKVNDEYFSEKRKEERENYKNTKLKKLKKGEINYEH